MQNPATDAIVCALLKLDGAVESAVTADLLDISAVF
jgi:hypothetical protein